MLQAQSTFKKTRLSMRRFFTTSSLILISILISSSAFALNLGVAGDYNAFIFGDFTSTSDSEGRLAAGGNIALQGYSVRSAGKNLSGPTTTALVAGGNLNFTDGTIYGNAVVGGTATVTGVDVKGTLSAHTTLLDFAAEELYLCGLSSQLSSVATSGTVQYESWGGIFLTGGGDSALQVFSIDGSKLSAANTFKFSAIPNIPDNATVLFNVSGKSVSMQNFGMQAFVKALGSSYDNILFNFFEAKTLTLSGIGFEGSILAPLASVTANNGNIDGTIIAASWNGSMELHNVPFEETSTPTPEPGTLVLLGVGMLLLGRRPVFEKLGLAKRKN